MSSIKRFKVLPCPFCGGGEDGLYFKEAVQNGRLNKLGKIQKRAQVDIVVACSMCGAEGPVTGYVSDVLDVSQQLLHEQRDAATVAWNTRDASSKAITGVIQAIAEKALRQINEQ